MENLARALPCDVVAERGVVGSILLDSTLGEDARVLDICMARGVTENSFSDTKMRLLYMALKDVVAKGSKIDLITLHDRLKTQGTLDAVGGMVTLQELVNATPTSAHAEHYIEIIRRKEILRNIIVTSTDSIKRCYDEVQADDVDTLLGEVEKDFLGIGSVAAVRHDWRTAVDNTLQSIERAFDKGGESFDGLSTGFKYIDEKLLGLKNGEMIVIAARPSVGKTSFAMNIAECVATGQDINGMPTKCDGGKQHPVLIFSLEMDTLSLSKRMLCGRAHVSSWRIARNLMPKSEKQAATQRLYTASTILKKAPIIIDDSSGLDITDLRARARRYKRTHGIELIVIDYLQLCNCREFAKQGRQIETSRISSNIKAMAKELNIPVIVLSQLSRANEKRGEKDEIPKLSDLRDSGAIEQDADVVMLLRRPYMVRSTRDDAETKNLAIVDVAKHRNGETGDVKMRFDSEWTRFGDLDPKAEGAPNRADEEAAVLAGTSEDVSGPAYDSVGPSFAEQQLV